MSEKDSRILQWAFIVYLTPIPFGIWATDIHGPLGSIIVPIIMVILMIPAYFRIKELNNK
tara:strand:+ start:215484 stop:215663 length:180 start_codon:yes stop_codon:yes gene_type:complete